MKAARLHNYDESVPPDSLKVEEIEEPKIEGPLDVIVRVGAAGLCRTDIHIIEGQWAPIQDPDGTLLPYVLGHENAGWVEEVGSGVTNVSVGDTVILHPLKILAGQTPRSVWASPQDVANCVAFLASPLSDHICRENVVVDGGWLIGTPVEVPEAEQEAPRGVRAGA
jgi:NADPH:quinone reductase-like Zn-dependent oxidoreductase